MANIKRRPPRTWAEAPEVMDSEYIAILLGPVSYTHLTLPTIA